jgi:hypothetical protein
MIVHTSCVKVGHRQAPPSQKPSPVYPGEGFCLGSIKRNLKAGGFLLESLPGPPGKREITRARKP